MKMFGKIAFVLAISLFMFTSCPSQQESTTSGVILYYSVEDGIGGLF